MEERTANAMKAGPYKMQPGCGVQAPSQESVICGEGGAYCERCQEIGRLRNVITSIANFDWVGTGSDTFEEAFDWCKQTAKESL